MSKFLLVAMLFGALSAPLAFADTFEEVGEDASQVIVNKYLVATKAQQNKLRGMASQVKIVGQLPKLAKTGNIAEMEMARAFNCGVGMVVVVAEAEAQAARDALAMAGEFVMPIGTIVARQTAKSFARL